MARAFGILEGEMHGVSPGSRLGLVLLWFFLTGPVVALGVGVALACASGIGPTWLDLGLAVEQEPEQRIAGQRMRLVFERESRRSR